MRDREAMIYTFDNGKRSIDFDLTPADKGHMSNHSSRMQEWHSPGIMNALSGVDWDKVQKNFPFYSLHCTDCNYRGSDYQSNGQPR